MAGQQATQELQGDEGVTLPALFWTFLKIGATAFGGFMALISVVQNYVVERRRLLNHEDMLDGVSLATMLPGPVAVNVVAYTGYRLRGVMGAVVCATAVTLPSFLLILTLSHLYFAYGEIPSVSQFFQGVIPAIAAIVAAAAWNMGKKAINGWREGALALAALGGVLLVGGFYSTLGVMAGAGVVGYLLFRPRRRAEGGGGPGASSPRAPLSSRLYSVAAAPAVTAVAPFLSTDWSVAGKLLVTFGGMSLVLFGGGFVFIPLIQETVVGEYGWVTQQEFIDSIAMGQVTPGPIVMSATFIGYKLGGLLGATAATVGIFAPPAILMVASSHYLQKIKGSENMKAVLKGLRSAIIGMIVAAIVVIAKTAEPNFVSAAIFVATLVALIKFKLEVVWIIPAAGAIGVLYY